MVLRKRSYIDDAGGSYDDMENELTPFENALERSKKGSGRIIASREHQGASRAILKSANRATESDLEAIIEKMETLQDSIETELNRIDKRERKDPGLKKDKVWMHVAGSLEDAFGEIEDTLVKLRKQVR